MIWGFWWSICAVFIMKLNCLEEWKVSHFLIVFILSRWNACYDRLLKGRLDWGLSWRLYGCNFPRSEVGLPLSFAFRFSFISFSPCFSSPTQLHSCPFRSSSTSSSKAPNFQQFLLLTSHPTTGTPCHTNAHKESKFFVRTYFSAD